MMTNDLMYKDGKLYFSDNILIKIFENDLNNGYMYLKYINTTNNTEGELEYFDLPKNITTEKLATMIRVSIENQGKGGIEIC